MFVRQQPSKNVTVAIPLHCRRLIVQAQKPG
jgi:hypothetical protein